MALTTTIKARVLSALGEDNSDYLDQISAPEELFNEALWDIAGVVPSRYLLTQIEQPVDPENMIMGQQTNGYNFNIEDKLVLLITRTEPDHTLTMGGDVPDIDVERYITKPCKNIPFEDSHKATDVNSMFYATKFSPIYTVKNVGGASTIFVYPETSGSFTAGNGPYTDGNILPLGTSTYTVFAYSRETIMETGGGTETDSAWDTMTEFKNIPRDIEDIVIKRIALKVIELKLSDMATQEEDTELFTLLTQNKALLEESLTQSIEKLRSEWA